MLRNSQALSSERRLKIRNRCDRDPKFDNHVRFSLAVDNQTLDKVLAKTAPL